MYISSNYVLSQALRDPPMYLSKSSTQLIMDNSSPG